MLQACGFASESPLGGIVGKEMRIAWYDLDNKLWRTPAKSNPARKTAMRSTMEIYDFEFDFRLDIAAIAHGRAMDSSDLLVVPVHSSECAECDWRNHCGPIIRDGAGDPTLLPGIDFDKWRLLRECGITNRADAAGLDHLTARLGADGVNVEKVLGLATEADPATLVASLIPRAKTQIAVLESVGIVTAGDAVDGLDPLTARVAGSSTVARAILEARAVLGPEPVYRLGPERPDVPRFDIEMDVDMENGIDGFVYLWGVWATDRAGTGLVEDGYVPFHSWDRLDGESEFAVFERFWVSLTDLRQRATTAGHTVGAFYWSDAETTQMRRIVRETPLEETVEEYIGSDEWVDLLPFFRDGWTTGEGAGLKTVATAIGFEWDVDDPSGADSMVMHRDAVLGDEDARAWLLEYNRGDVEATLAVREWMVGVGRDVIPVPSGSPFRR
jgi:predicted RecB family nuclease